MEEVLELVLGFFTLLREHSERRSEYESPQTYGLEGGLQKTTVTYVAIGGISQNFYVKSHHPVL